MSENRLIHEIKHNSEIIAEVNIENDEILDPLMYTTSSIKDYLEGIIDEDDESLHDPTVIVAIINEDGSKRFGMTTFSRLTIPRLSNNEYNTEKFQKLYFKCGSNVDWPHASNQADLGKGLLMSLRIQFPPLSEGFIRWADLHNYLMSNDDGQVRAYEYTKNDKTHEYYIIPLKKTESLPGVVSYSFYIHQTVFERNPAYVEHAKNLSLYDEQWNVSASHCQPENNHLYVPLHSNGSEIVNTPEVFPVISDEFTRWIQIPVRSGEETPVLTPSEAEDIIEALSSDEPSGVVRNLNDAFDEAEEDDSDDEEYDIINIYTDDNSELTEVVELYCNDIDKAVEIYGNPDDWNIVMHNYERREFDFGDFSDDDDEDDDEDNDEEDDDGDEESRGPRLTIDELATSETEEAPRTPDTSLRTPTTPVREPSDSSERRFMTIDEFREMIYKNREDWLEGEPINLAQETFKHHRENITIRLPNREELNKAFKLTRDMVIQAFNDQEKIYNDEMDEEIHPYFVGNTPYEFDWDVSGVEDFSKLGEEFVDTAELASETLPHNDGFYSPKNLENWDMSSAVDLSEMFKNCLWLIETISLKNWGDKLGNVRDASGMFEGCTEYDDDLSSWDVSSFTMIDNMFKECFSFNGNFSSWSMPNLISCSGFIRDNYPQERLPSEIFDKGCMERESEQEQSGEGNIITIDEFREMVYKNREDWMYGRDINLAQESFKHQNIIFKLNNREELIKAFKLTRDMLETANEDDDEIRAGAMDEEIHPYFLGNTPYKFDWDVSEVEDFSKLGVEFFDTAGLASESIPFTAGNYWPKNLENWDLSSAVDLSEMFKGCTNLEHISLKNWGDKLGNVRDASGMFEGCTEYDDDLSSWDVSSFTMIDNMFKECFSFEGNFSSWSMPNLISCSGFIRDNYLQERLPSIIFDKGCMERESEQEQSVQNAGGVRDGSRIPPEQYCQKGGALDRKIKHLENYVMSKGLYYLPAHIVNDAKNMN